MRGDVRGVALLFKSLLILILRGHEGQLGSSIKLRKETPMTMNMDASNKFYF
jgi:hypothetical protein